MKAMLEAKMLELESDGSSPDVSDSDEMLTLDELMEGCVVDFDAKAHAGVAGPSL